VRRWVDEYYYCKLTGDDSSIQAASVVLTDSKQNDKTNIMIATKFSLLVNLVDGLILLQFLRDVHVQQGSIWISPRTR
jgi:hypothetical protein